MIASQRGMPSWTKQYFSTESCKKTRRFHRIFVVKDLVKIKYENERKRGRIEENKNAWNILFRFLEAYGNATFISLAVEDRCFDGVFYKLLWYILSSKQHGKHCTPLGQLSITMWKRRIYCQRWRPRRVWDYVYKKEKWNVRRWFGQNARLYLLAFANLNYRWSIYRDS